MAYDYNSVPLGQAGTGAAFLLPGSVALDALGRNLDENRQTIAQNQALRYKQAQQMAADWNKNKLVVKGNRLFQPEIANRTQELINMGLELRKAGVDPYNPNYTNPQATKLSEEYLSRRSQLMQDSELRDALVKQADANEKLLSTQPDGFFDPESIAAYHDFIGGKTSLSDISKRGLTMPEIKKRFNIESDLFQKLKPSQRSTTSLPINGVKRSMVLPVDADNFNTVKGAIDNNPVARSYVEKQIGLPLSQLPNTTDRTKVLTNLDAYFKSEPNQQQLAAAGVSSYTDPAYKQLLESTADKYVTAQKQYDNIVKDGKEYLNNQVHKQDKKEYDFEYQKEMDRRENLGMTRVRFNEWKKGLEEAEGTFNVGNTESYVPVIKQYNLSANGQPVKGTQIRELEPGAALFSMNVPSVNMVLQPAKVTNLQSGKTYRNAQPQDVKVSGIKMVPVFRNLEKDSKMNGSEISLRQMDEISSGKSKNYSLKNVTFQPFTYGFVMGHDDKGHVVEKPVKFSYSDLKQSGGKKFNTNAFDEAVGKVKELQDNPKFKQLSPSQQWEAVKSFWNVQAPANE